MTMKHLLLSEIWTGFYSDKHIGLRNTPTSSSKSFRQKSINMKEVLGNPHDAYLSSYVSVYVERKERDLN
jgi:hypothetical protein